jgi:hypothetical protein
MEFDLAAAEVGSACHDEASAAVDLVAFAPSAAGSLDDHERADSRPGDGTLPASISN